ncbi:23S rRNA (guanosine(2251)-2'-O)-methyltransferase RlmB [Candidatus Doolittlea endobia]|uniref:23S rRNA (guanosine-2'-O-)-methyltransferase RlmB n=1 Tax=Candidatus Doolittlea endobia TaxID=1778262 RepID=A0A143WS42_9ENTR|nr:23S rRNA (guanosine(2251)-2'-O)-methyltransferase RlmB [Candidatus Doolittlea endobia]CUX96552.1 23S rRNA (guanosine-2'-O-)-methyltransferase RlmB [Candidatus Doolittlea endobia]
MSEIIYGIHAIQALLECDHRRFLDVYLLKGRDDRRLQSLVQRLESADIAIQMVSRQWLNEKVKGAVHQGIVARVREVWQCQESNLPAFLKQQVAPFLLVLDGVTDPHNLGACLRCADAAGVHAVIVPRDRTAPLNATAKKVASGAGETVPLIRVINLARTQRLLQEHNVRIVGTVGEADHHIYQSKLTGSLAIVMGSEGDGMRHLTRKYCDELISIPMAGTVSSLNVSVAAGVCLFEAVRQRLCLQKESPRCVPGVESQRFRDH